MNNSIHTLEYKGYAIHCENGLYWLSVNPTRKFINFESVKKEVDKVANDLAENIQNIKQFMKPKTKL